MTTEDVIKIATNSITEEIKSILDKKRCDVYIDGGYEYCGTWISTKENPNNGDYVRWSDIEELLK